MEYIECSQKLSLNNHVVDRDFIIRQFNTSDRLRSVLKANYGCRDISDDCLSCKDEKDEFSVCFDGEVVSVDYESGATMDMTPFEVLSTIIEEDPIEWLKKENLISLGSNEQVQRPTQVGRISFFKGPITNTKPEKEIGIEEVYEFIRSDNLKELTAQLRKIKELDEKQYKASKAKLLPSVTFGGSFEKRANSKIRELSNLMCFDIDDIEDVDRTITQLLDDIHLGIILLFISPGGNGLKAVLRSPLGLDYSSAYQSIRDYLKMRLGIETDPTSDISRACFLCHDENVFYNAHAIVTCLPKVFNKELKNKSLPTDIFSIGPVTNSGNLKDIDKVNFYLLALEENSIDITDNYSEWLRVGFAFAGFGEDGRALFHRLSRLSEKYVPSEANEKFTNLLSTGKGEVGLGTFFYRCHKYGIRPAEMIPGKQDSIKKSSHYLSSSVQSNKLPKKTDKIGEPEKKREGNSKSDIDWERLLNEHKIDPSEDIPKPPIAWKSGEATCGTLGNYSLIIGKAKSRKSFFVSMVVGGILKGNSTKNPFSSNLLNPKNRVLLFDTEQSKYHVQCIQKRIHRLVECEDSMLKLSVYALRPLSPQERLAIIDYAISNTTDVAIVVIDGIADLQTDINNPEQAVMVATKLLKWTEQKNIHIITVLHENKGDRNARGHLGTELVNKAETTLSVTRDKKNPNISIVEPEYCRNIEPGSFAFEIDNGLPIRSLTYEHRTGGSVKAENLDDEVIGRIINKVFETNQEFSYSSLWRSIKIAYNGLYTGNLADNQAKSVIEIARMNKLIYQKANRGPYFLGSKED